jgi:hypothetical protein
MIKFVKGVLLAGLVGALLPGPATAQLNPGLTPAEFKCEQGVSKSGGKYVQAVTKCATKCQQGFYKNDLVNFPGGVADCYAPYGGAALACVTTTPLKSADAKFAAAIKKACDPAVKVTNECPDCYDAAAGNNGCGDSGYAGAHVQDIGNQVAAFGPGVFCKTTGASKAEQKCEQNTGKVLSKHVGSIDKCFDKCFKNASKALNPASDCVPNPLLPSDTATQTCVNTASSKAALGVDKLCTTAGVNLQCPQFCGTDADCGSNSSCTSDGDCSGGDTCVTGACVGSCVNLNCASGSNSGSAGYPNGSLWVNLVTSAIAGNVVDSGLGPNTGIYCDAP